MSMFHSARRTKIIGGNFNIIQGNQNNNSCSHSQSSKRSLVRIQPGEEWKEMLYQEYERISLGKIKLLRTLCDKPLVTPSGRYMMTNSEMEDSPEAERVVEVASIVDGREESLPLLTIRYAGRNAKELFKEDCIHFALQRTSTTPQFRAFNDSNIPMIIFNEALSGTLVHRASDEHRARILSTLGDRNILMHLGLSWFRPQTGALCFGPPGPYFESEPSKSSFAWTWQWDVEDPWRGYDRFKLPPIPLNICTDTTFLDHIMHNVPERLVVRTVSSAAANDTSLGPALCGVCDWKGRLMADKKWTRSWDSRDFSRLVLKLRPSDQWRRSYTYEPVSNEQDQCKPMGKGAMRLRLTHSINSAGFFFFLKRTNNFQYRTFKEEWLAQAGWIFGSLRVPRERWSSSAIVEGITLDLSSDAKEWFEPPPTLPNGAPDIETWLRGEELYYYSDDPEGGSVISEQERIALGLPSYTSQVNVEYVHWEADAYNFMEQWQKAKGFDYSTPDYAKHLGFTILEGIPQGEVCFEDLFGAHREEVLVDDLMDVDSELGSTRGNYDPSSSDADMDVDD
ncbi:hypothetical protein PQX77_002633 [Marasmius sp. AFHP31]|nr:hypothetical protein PQX77_002633 [Marasmius sp. AFHP31]